MRKLRAHYIWGILATEQLINFDLPICYKKVKIKPYKTIILPVLYGWSLKLMKEHGMRVLENRMLKRVLGSKRNSVAGGWRKLNFEEIHNVFFHTILLV
jgi:hypothetical protein